ncbi:hypothetical protein OUZ56_003191 [Daphnia magna]|uniref:Uncharacterized protein n=1 Tax=Daphnia magna TaxID=35525 RepID=A0ABR0A811_9CRUS|nr:hypothetical protein OUZ56_003191 [Daphnia magna]
MKSFSKGSSRRHSPGKRALDPTSDTKCRQIGCEVKSHAQLPVSPLPTWNDSSPPSGQQHNYPYRHSSLSGHGGFYVDTNSSKKISAIINMMFEMHQNSQCFQSLLENKLNYLIDKMDNLRAQDVAARIQDHAEYHTML